MQPTITPEQVSELIARAREFLAAARRFLDAAQAQEDTDDLQR